MILVTVCVSAASAWQTPQPNASAGGQPQTPAIYTSRTAFRIPYQYDAREIARLGAKEIRLYVSQDHGRQWTKDQSVEAKAGRFDFQAKFDGEYWFAVRTIDHQGQPHPGGELRPGLAVVVDTRKPLLKINLSQPAPGRVALNWVAVDDNIDPESVQLEFSQSGIPDWRPIGSRPTASGQTSWTVPAGGTVAVRGRVRDRAGNETSTQYQIQVSPAGAYGTPPGSDPGRLPPQPAPRAIDPRRTTDPGVRVPGRVPGQRYGDGASPSFGPVPGTTATGRYPTPAPQQIPGPSFGPSFGPSAAVDAGFGVPPVPGQIPGTCPFGPPPAPTGAHSSADSPQWRDAFASAVPNRSNVQDFPSAQSLGHRKVQSRQFQIDYQVDDVGPSGIAAVELFVTQNDGEKWYRYGIDEDRQSPFDVDVPADGVYGFTMRVVSGAGLTDPPPQHGQKPDIVIEVDASPPVVQLFPLKQGQGAQSNRILITWQAEDYKLAERPIALSWSPDPEGPWKLITDWLPNTGEYVWTVPQGIPPRLYLRVVARDAIGNMARVDTPQPVLVDMARPSARIVNVESAGRR
jgi:hypothetical protein